MVLDMGLWNSTVLHRTLAAKVKAKHWIFPPVFIAGTTGSAHMAKDTGGADALNAVGAFFHRPAPPYRHVRISHRLKAGRVVIRVLEEIEASDFVGTIVRAITRADAPVINLQIESLFVMHGCATGQTTSQGAFSHCMQGTG